MAKLFRITTVPVSVEKLLGKQLTFMNQFYEVTAISSDKEDLERVGQELGIKTKAIEMTRKITPIQDLKSLWQMYCYLKKEKPRIRISWKTAWWSGLVGGLSHVLLDGLIYPDMSPFWPFVQGTRMDVFTSRGMTAFCIFSGLAGLLVYFVSRSVEAFYKHHSEKSN